MYRKGKYTKKVTPARKARRFLKRRWEWFKALKWYQKALVIGAPILAFLIITPILTYLYYYNDIGNAERLMNRNNTGIVIYDKDGKEFFRLGKAAHRELVPLDKISDDFEHALIAAEDKDFYNHSGFSVFGIMRALYGNILSRDITGGGSTITQQLAKNTLLSDQQTVMRKYQELVVALAIEQRYSKDEILTMYINSIHYGENTFGIEQAAKVYFNKKPSQLSLAESAMLVGVLPAPGVYSPISGNKQYAKERQTTVLTRMVNNGYITEQQKEQALKVKLKYAKQSAVDNPAPHFTEMVLNQLYQEYGEEKALRSGYQIKTTLDLSLQKAANSSVTSGMAHIEANGGSNASLVAINPSTGGVLALVGSKDYDNEKFGKANMATTARQPGSSFKPIYYADALASGKITPTTVYRDEPINISGYQPLNADRSFRGNVTVRQALNWSLNIPAVKVMQEDGIDSAVSRAEKLGISTLKDPDSYGLSLALGSAEVPLTEMTSAYGAFANAGELHARKVIQSINDKFDKTIFTAKAKSDQAISEQGAYLISNILSDSQTRSRIFGSSLNVQGTDFKAKTVAVKTGTTDDARDAWTIGYTPQVAIGVWVGNNDNTPMNSGGADMAGPIWREAMGQAIGAGNPTFTQPAGVVKASVCTNVGTLSDVFLVDHVPKQCEQSRQEEKKEEKPATTTQKCTIAGKETLNANDPKCVEDLCEVPGKEDLAANDPNCKEDTGDSDGDGVLDAGDQCPDTPPGTAVDATGCPTSGLLPLSPFGLSVRRLA